jgi:hypothetical protein
MSGQRFGITTLFIGALLAASAAVAAESAAGTEQAGWRHSKATITYFGFTSRYTCYGIEDKTRQILLLLGARKDAKVRASGCEVGSNRPSRSAWVTVEFDALASGPPGAGAEAVAGHWKSIEIAPNRPFDMGAGDCELFEQLRDVVTKGFAFKDLDYHTSCVPHQTSIGSYSVKGQVLTAAPVVSTK